jgi:hypothetical protein
LQSAPAAQRCARARAQQAFHPRRPPLLFLGFRDTLSPPRPPPPSPPPNPRPPSNPPPPSPITSVANLLEDLKSLYRSASVSAKPVCLILGDSDVDRDERFLEYISQLLATGEVAGMIPRDELDAMLEAVRPAFKREKGPQVADTRDALRGFLAERASAALHVVLCLSPAGGKFARRAQQFPGIVAGTAIDWFLPWPREALVSGERRVL